MNQNHSHFNRNENSNDAILHDWVKFVTKEKH